METIGNRYAASFPEGISRPIQYGINVKDHSTNLSQYQLILMKMIQTTVSCVG